MMLTKEQSTQQMRMANQSFDASSPDFQLQMSRNQSTQQVSSTQGVGFFQQLQYAVFGGGNQSYVNQSGSNTGRSQKSDANNPQQIPGKGSVQIFLDLQYKSFSRQAISDDTTVSELLKILKQKYTVSSSQINASPGAQTFVNGMYQKGQMQQSVDSRKTAPQKMNRSGQGNDMSVQKDEYGLFLIKGKANVENYKFDKSSNITKGINPQLSIRKLQPNDFILRVYTKANADLLNENNNFKLVFAKYQEIEQYLKSKGFQQSQFDEENHVVSQLGKSIINNKTYERKGKLFKKSLNSDKFKERQFMLDKDQLFYYKNEKQKDKNFNLIMLSNATIHILENFNKEKYCFQIENDNRKYILKTKSQYDLEQWVFAIQGQIRLSKDNKNIADINNNIMLKEKEVAHNDMLLIQKVFKPKNIIFNPIQPILLEFVNDPFINELLPNLTQYISLVREKEYQRQALEKAKDIVKQLRSLDSKLQKSLPSDTSSIDVMSVSSEFTVEKPAMIINQQVDDYKHYKDLKPELKIQCLFSHEDLSYIEQSFQKTLQDSQDTSKQLIMDQKLFNNILLKIHRILKYNYLEAFFQQKKVELLSIPTINSKIHLPKLEFNSIGPNVLSKGNKNCNIFEAMLLKKGFSDKMGASASVQIDPAFQNQLKNFLGNISEQQKNNGSLLEDKNGNIITGISKINSNVYDDRGSLRL